MYNVHTAYNVYTTHVQCAYNVHTMYTLHMYNVHTMCIQCIHYTCTMCIQCIHYTCTMCIQCAYNVYTTHVQCSYYSIEVALEYTDQNCWPKFYVKSILYLKETNVVTQFLQSYFCCDYSNTYDKNNF